MSEGCGRPDDGIIAVMNPEKMAKYADLDVAAAECGGYVDPNPPPVDWNIRDVLDYCREHGISPESLSDGDLCNITRAGKRQSAA